MAQLRHTDDHDTVIRKYSELITKNNPDEFKIITSLSEGENKKLEGIVPDILLQDKNNEIHTNYIINSSLVIMLSNDWLICN